MNEESLFHEALGKPNLQDRAAFLDAACAGQPALRKAVEALLAAHDASRHPLDQPSIPDRDQPGPDFRVMPTVAPQSTMERVGARIGPYKLLQEIGEGGMGTVWMAEQSEPVRRTVALKIIKPGMDSSQVIARFEAERQALAIMDHPNIAKVLEAGATESGRPYFVMELVKGTPITRYCDEHRLSLRQRLELFGSVCQALQHAHQKGIIHRDIKPSNVLVAPYDGRPVVKVIDFGVAKAMGQRLTDKTMFTEFGAIVGTLQYMSPEQAELNNQDIDTRSDIYSLGVLLYELLTGTTPLDMNRMRGVAIAAVLMAINEDEPQKPSTRLSESVDSLPSVAAQRQTDPVKLPKLVRGELDWIVMKALDKDRNRRFETANSFAMDIQRYLANEPVLAGPPSATYRLRKFLRRNKGAVSAAALVLLALVCGIVGTTWGMVRAQRARAAEEERAEGERLAKEREAEQRRIAESRRQEAELQRGRAETNEQKAVSAAARAEAVKNFLIKDMLTSADPEAAKGREITVKEVLSKAAVKVGRAFPGDPATEAEVRTTIGMTNWSLGFYSAAEEQLLLALEMCRRELGEQHHDTLACMNFLGIVLLDQGKFAEAEPLLRKSLEFTRIQVGSPGTELEFAL